MNFTFDDINLTLLNENDTVTIKCIEKSTKIYERKFTQTDAIELGIGNILNFHKVCKEVFSNIENSPHTVSFEHDDNNVYIKIIYLSMLEFNINLKIPFTTEISFNEDINNEINNIKKVLSGALEGIKQMAFEISEIKNTKSTEPYDSLFLKIIGDISELKNMFGSVKTDVNKLEKFVYSEINEIKLSENDNSEKIPINCPNLTINMTECACCAVNKFVSYNGEINYLISMDPKFKFTENFKNVKCKELTVNIQSYIDTTSLVNLPVSVGSLIINGKNDNINFGFMTTAKFNKLKTLHLQNIMKSTNLETILKYFNIEQLEITNSDLLLKDYNILSFGYQLKDEIKNTRNYPSIVTLVYRKIDM